MNEATTSRRRFLMRAAGAAALVAGGGSLLAACGDDDDDSGAGTATTTAGEGATTTTALTPAKLTSMMPFTASIGYLVDLTAKTAGHFESQKLDVDIQFARSAGQAFQALLAGQAQLARIGVLNLVQGVADQDAPAIAIAMPTQGLLYRLVTPKDKPIATLDALKGKTVGFPSLAGNAEDTFNLILQEAKIDPAAVKRVAAGFDAAAFGLAQEGKIDALFTNIDVDATLRFQGAPTADTDLGKVNPLLGNTMAATKSYTDDNASVITRYLKALDLARADLNDETKLDALLPQLASQWQIRQLSTPPLAKKIIAEYAPIWRLDDPDTFQRCIPADWTRGINGFREIGVLEKDIPATTFFTNKYVDEALG